MKKKKVLRKLDSGQKLWLESKKVIAGGNMLFSKRPDTFLPNIWPAYFKKTDGCKVIDLDNKIYFDISSMSVGTNSLGYSNKKIDNAVKNAIKKGNMSTLNCPEEVYLAKKLLKIHPWAHKVRFARTGGEANSIAIRLARASTKRKNIAFCGYHGWHDWYLAANIKSKNNLSGHLLNGLKVEGVPPALKKTIFPFVYNNYNGLEKLVKKYNIGIIKMEVVRNEMPKNNFLKKVRNLANKNKIILIFDECTTGFRQTFGGIHKLYKVNPDMLILGKALGNGYAITSVLGKKKIMNNIKNTFISSTFWTERIGSVAALKTLEIMEKEKSWKKITKIGKKIIRNWKSLAYKHKLNLKIFGIPALCSFAFVNKNNNLYKTYITQEMLKKGFLASNVVYASLAHKDIILRKYFKQLDIIFKQIKNFEKGENIYNYLETHPATQNFARLN
jgi:glutamate-1-semialdehyde 2,1-aminomutase